MSLVARCPKCGYRLPPPKPLVRVCAKCKKPIDRHHKYETVIVKERPRPQYEFHHRHCDNPDAYLPKERTPK